LNREIGEDYARFLFLRKRLWWKFNIIKCLIALEEFNSKIVNQR